MSVETPDVEVDIDHERNTADYGMLTGRFLSASQEANEQTPLVIR